jgi:dynein heavy chain
MNKCFNIYVNKIMEFKKLQCNELVLVPEPNAVQSLCKLLEVLATPENGVELLDDRDAFNNICKLWFLFW